MKKFEIEITNSERATILLSLIRNRHFIEESLRTGKTGNYKLTKNGRESLEYDLKIVKDLEKFFDSLNED